MITEGDRATRSSSSSTGTPGDPRGREVAEVGPGAWFGELALLDDRPRSATVVATSPITVVVLGVRMFRTISGVPRHQ